MKIIIEYDEKTTDAYQAMRVVGRVVCDGRISIGSKDIKHFCWVTVFKSGFSVYVRGKRGKINAADSFLVINDKK